MMKVVHLLPALEQGGVETVVCDLVRALPDCDSVVVSKGGRLVARVEASGGRHVVLNLKSKNPLTYFIRVWRLRQILRREKPDLVCVHSRVPAWLYVGVRKLDSIIRSFDHSISSPPWITYAHGANSVSRYSAVMTKGDRIVVPSRFLADYLKLHYGTSESKIRVIPNAIDAERFDPNRLDGAFVAAKRREWNIRKGDRVTMAIGRITPVKGLEGLIRGFRGGKLVIVGGADKHHKKYLESLKKLASTVHLHLSPSPVIFAGPQERIPECISIADEIVSANTTKPETFGLSVVEAYAMNKPVHVTRRFGGVAEVMEAVEKSGKPSLREAVLDLYGIDRFAARTAAVYREMRRTSDCLGKGVGMGELRSVTIDRAFGDLDKVERLYYEDFPEEERIPFASMLAFARMDGMCFEAYYDGDLFVGWQLSHETKRFVSDFYLVVDRRFRGRGYGARIVKLLYERRLGKISYFEVEEPDESAANAEQRRKRIEFHMRTSGSRIIPERILLMKGMRFLSMSNEHLFPKRQQVAGAEYVAQINGMRAGISGLGPCCCCKGRGTVRLGSRLWLQKDICPVCHGTGRELPRENHARGPRMPDAKRHQGVIENREKRR